jgi:RND family efflux transporter MFP subunit
VEIATVEAAELEGTEEVVGTVRAKLRATLEAKVSGQIASLDVSVGDRVTKGDLLAKLSVSEVRAQLVEARAVLEQAEQDLARTRRLFEDDAASQRDLDAAEARFRVARAKVREARSVLDYARIEAPFDGVVTHKLADVGDLATPGRPLLEVEDPSALRLEVAVPEALSRFVGLGATLDVEVDALDAPTTGTVAEIAPSVDPNSRTLLVKLDLPPAEGLRAGQFGRALVPTGRAEVLRVPEDAVVRRGQLEIAFVVHEGRAVLRLVKTAKRTGDQLEVVSGLEPGEVIVVEGARDLSDGQRVALPTEVSS